MDPKISIRPLVSTIIPYYNDGWIIQRAVNSVLNQQGNLRLEITIVDDGSSAEFSEIPTQIASLHSNVSVIRKPNGGLSSARNAGIASAQGDYFHFLDSDDYIYLNTYEEMLGALAGRTDAIAYCSTEMKDLATGSVIKLPLDPLLPSPLHVLSERCPFAVHAALLPRDVLKKNGLFDETLTACEDWDYWLRAAQKGVSFTSVHQLFVVYERRAKSMSRSYVNMLSGAARVVAGGNAFIGHPNREAKLLEMVRPRMFYLACAGTFQNLLVQSDKQVFAEAMKLIAKDPLLLPHLLRYFLTRKKLVLRTLFSFGRRVGDGSA